jgi:hypothetical protein
VLGSATRRAANRTSFRAQHVEWRIGHLFARRVLEREQTDLWAIAVRDNQIVPLGDRSEMVAGNSHIGPLILRRHRLATTQQRIPAQRDDEVRVNSWITAEARMYLCCSCWKCATFAGRRAQPDAEPKITMAPIAGKGFAMQARGYPVGHVHQTGKSPI